MASPPTIEYVELESSNFQCFVAFAAWSDFEFDFLALFKVSVAVAFDVAEVNEYVFALVT